MNNARIDPSVLAAQRRGRIHALRMRVAAGAATAFLAIWGVLFVQLATGHDPGLNDAASVAVVQSADPAASSSGSSDALTQTNTDDGSGMTDDASDGTGSSDSSDPSSSSVDSGAVTTSQS